MLRPVWCCNMNPEKVICPCYKVTKGDIARAIQEGAASFKEVKQATKASKACGKCKKKVKKLTKKLLEEAEKQEVGKKEAGNDKKYPAIPHLKNNPTLEDHYYFLQNVVYSQQTGEDLKLSMILPWRQKDPAIPNKPMPLLVFVQGSGWCTPDFDHEIPQLALFAHAGFVVATVGHRDSTKGHPFPAYLQDVKCAIRYLRKHAEEYSIDPEHVVIWGTSSGGNTAMLVGLTGDEERYETAEHAGYSDKVNAVVNCFGPTDIGRLMIPYLAAGQTGMCTALSGSAEMENWEAIAEEMSPVNHVEAGKEYPPFLLLHGTADQVVLPDQLEEMYHKLLDCQVDVQAYLIDEGVHEHNFWTKEVREIIMKFVLEKK